MSARSLSLPLLLAALASSGGAHAAGFPTEPSPAVVQPAPPQLSSEPDRWLPFQVFDVPDGLNLSSLTTDRQGYLWAGSAGRASRYNGHTWRHVDFPTDSSAALVSRLLGASDGSLWLGTRSHGIFRLHDGVWSSFQLEDRRLAQPMVNSLVETSHAGRAVLWAATRRGVARCEAGACRPVPALWGLATRDLVPTRDNKGRMALWVSTEKGLVRLDTIETPTPALGPILFDHRNALPSDSVRSLAESVSAEGRRSLWVGTDQGLARLRDGLWTRYDSGSGFPSSSVFSLLPGRWGGRPVVWAATWGAGLIRIDEEDGRWEVFGASSGLPSDYLYTLHATDSEVKEPTLWIETTEGLARLGSRRWHTIDSRVGLPSDIVTGAGEDLFPDGRRAYWIGTDKGTVRLTDQGWQAFVPFSGASSPAVFDIAWSREEKELVFWMATAQGLFRHSGGVWTPALPVGQAALLETIPAPGGDEIWVRNLLSALRLAAGQWSTFLPGSAGLPGRVINDLSWSRAGREDVAVWVGTDAGLARFASGRWQPVEAPCLPHSGVLALSIFADSEGSGWLWAGTLQGAARVRLARGQVVPGDCWSLTKRTHPQLSDSWIYDFVGDQAGRIYIVGDRAVVRLTAPAEGPLESARVEVFDAQDALPEVQLIGIIEPFLDRRGRIWSSSSSGTVIFDPADEPRRTGPSRPAPLRIERILVRDQERSSASSLELRHREGRLEIEYALLRFQREHATRYQTQLVGLDDQPSPWTRETRAVYDRLPPGDYVFRVWGRDGDGVISGPAERSFAVLPPPWLTPWAFALYALALIGLVYGAVRLRVRTLARRAAQLEALVAERTRDLAEANRRLELASFTDPLTGLHNRRFLTSTIQLDVVQAIRNHREPLGDPGRQDLVVYLLDLDHFKRLNDRAGHDAGDAVLVETARRLRRVVRSSDLVVRWGGEEILVVSRWTDREMGALLAGRLLEAIGGEPFRTGADRSSTVTCSLGWAPFPWSAGDPDAVLFEEVLSLADHALYLAKREGRNRGVGVLPGAAPAEEVAERILREDAPLHSLEGMQVELVWTPGPPVAADDRTTTMRAPLTPSGPDAMLRGPI